MTHMSSPKHTCSQPCTELNWEHNSVPFNSLPWARFWGARDETQSPASVVLTVRWAQQAASRLRSLKSVQRELESHGCTIREPGLHSWALPEASVEELGLPWSWVCEAIWVGGREGWQAGGRARTKA